MKGLECKIRPERRQAMLAIRELDMSPEEMMEFTYLTDLKFREVARVPVFVWPMPTTEGLFVVEHQDGTVQRVQPDSLTFLGSKELFDQYDWSEA